MAIERVQKKFNWHVTVNIPLLSDGKKEWFFLVSFRLAYPMSRNCQGFVKAPRTPPLSNFEGG